MWLIRNTTRDNAMLNLSCKFRESKWNPCWLIMLTSSSGTNRGLYEHEDDDQYGSFALPSKIMLYQSQFESLVNQNEYLIELSCSRAQLALIMSLISMNMLTNFAHLRNHPRQCQIKPPCKFSKSNWNPYWVIVLNKSSGTNHVPNQYEGVDEYASIALPSDIMPC